MCTFAFKRTDARTGAKGAPRLGDKWEDNKEASSIRNLTWHRAKSEHLKTQAEEPHRTMSRVSLNTTGRFGECRSSTVCCAIRLGQNVQSKKRHVRTSKIWVNSKISPNCQQNSANNGRKKTPYSQQSLSKRIREATGAIDLKILNVQITTSDEVMYMRKKMCALRARQEKTSAAKSQEAEARGNCQLTVNSGIKTHDRINNLRKVPVRACSSRKHVYC